jgi:glutathione S-transferase
MTTLYYSPGACSLSPHIALREAGLPFDMVRVTMSTKDLEGGGSLLAVNPKGQVPTLRLDDGTVLTEGPAIVQWIADRAPASGLAPPNGTIDRYRLQTWLNFVSTEIHKGFSPLFNPKMPDEAKDLFRGMLAKKFGYLDAHLADNAFLMGDAFTVADGYCFTCVNWTNFVKIDLSPYPNLQAYMGRVAARPKVQAALKAEGLAK